MLKLGAVPKIAPPDEGAVQALQTVPANWSLECDEELAKFLFEKTVQVDELLGVSSSTSTPWKCPQRR